MRNLPPGYHRVPPLDPAPPAEFLESVPVARRSPVLACYTRPVDFVLHEGFTARRRPAAGGGDVRADEAAAFRVWNWQRWRLADLVERMRGRRLTAGALQVLAGWASEVVDGRNRIAEAHIGLVHLVAGRTTPMLGEDGRQSLQIVLVRAVEHFSADRGLRFSTYATSALFRESWKRRRLERLADERLPVERLGATMTANLADRDPWELADDAEEAEAERQAIRDLVAELEPRTQFVLARRFGFDGGAMATLEQIATDLGLTKEAIRQIQNRGLAELREKLAGGG